MRPTLLLMFCVVRAFCASTFYVDAVGGNDAASGTAIDSPWKTLGRVNRTNFSAGDHVLFKAGAVWRGQLVPRGSGTPQSPVIFDRYGRGPKPKIDAEGRFEDAVRLYNIQNIELRDFEITNHGNAPVTRRGVHIFLDNFGTANHVLVADLYIHDVNGTNGSGDNAKDNGGIIFRTVGRQVPSRFDGLTIERNLIRSVDRSGIAADSYHAMRTRWFPSLHVIIRDNYVDDIGGDGIVPWATDGVLVEHNIARNCNRRAHSYNAGIWPWSTDNSTFQLNEASFTRTTLDGEGFDSDYNSRNTLFQYNYSHDNEGGFMLICTPGKRKEKENLGNVGTRIRYNISRNDKARAFHISGGEHVVVDRNVIYVGPGIDLQMLTVTNWSGWASDVVFQHNVFWVQGTARYGHEAKRLQDGTYEIAPGWGPARDIVFDANHYIGRNVDRPADKTGTYLESASAPSLDWSGPDFNTMNPDGFSSFLTVHRKWITHLFEQQFADSVKLGRW